MPMPRRVLPALSICPKLARGVFCRAGNHFGQALPGNSCPARQDLPANLAGSRHRTAITGPPDGVIKTGGIPLAGLDFSQTQDPFWGPAETGRYQMAAGIARLRF